MNIQNEIIDSIDRLEIFINQLINDTNIPTSTWAMKRSKILLYNIRQNVWKQQIFKILLPKLPEDLINNILLYIK